MVTTFRVPCSIVAGLGLALGLLTAIELLSEVVHPTPPGSTGTMEEICEHVARYPRWVLAVAVPAWAGTAFASTWVARRIGNRGAAIFVGLLLLAAAAFNVANLPYPMWFKVVNPIAVPLASLLAIWSPGSRKPTIVNA